MTAPRVSVVMPVHNAARFLERALAGIEAQTFRDFEAIIVDDGSTDETKAILSRASQRDPRYRVVRVDHAGATAAMAAGVELAAGDLIARHDADDVSEPHRFERQVEYLSARPNVSAVGTAGWVLDEADNRLRPLSVVHGPSLVRKALHEARAVPVHGSMMIRKERLADAGGYRLAFRASQDVDLWLRLVEKGDVDNLPETLYGWRLTRLGVYSQNRLGQLKYCGIAVAFAEERRIRRTDSYDLLAQCGEDLERFAQRYQSRARLEALWGELIFRGLDDAATAHAHFAAAVRGGAVRPRTVALLGWSSLGFGWPGSAPLQAIPGSRPPRVLMVTGAYHPEVSGGARQCGELIRALSERVLFRVLTTTTRSETGTRAVVDGVPVLRVRVNIRSVTSQVRAAFTFVRRILELRHQADIIHVHGFSRKMVLVAVLARVLRKKLVLTLHTGGHDSAIAIRSRSSVEFWAYSRADLVTAVSPGLEQDYLAAGLPANRLSLIPNAVDVRRFCPADDAERSALRVELGLRTDHRIVLFIGFFSRDKRPDILFEAWSKVAASGRPTTLVYVGATRATYNEIDPRLADEIRASAVRRQLGERVRFVEITHAIEKYLRAADVYVLPSVREGLPLALIEAMACGLACIASRLPGSTDLLVEHGVNGLLVVPDDAALLSDALATLVEDVPLCRTLGGRARDTAVSRFSIAHTSARYAEVYRRLLHQTAPYAANLAASQT